MNPQRPVIVQQLPATLDQECGTFLLTEMMPLLTANRAHVVFDFSEVTEVDSAGVGVLLQCAAEVIKGIGDLKFAAIRPGPAVILELAGITHLFEIFESTADAVESF